MKIGIIGQGFVGSAIREGLKNFYKVNTYDLNPEKCNTTHEEVCKESNIIFMCLPTPMRRDGSCDTSVALEVLTELNRRSYKGVCAIKSTIIPDYLHEFKKTFNLKIVYNPEFLTEANSFDDFVNPNFQILGGKWKDCEVVEKAYLRHSKVKIVPTFKTDLTTASLIKYTVNSWLATKVIFFNDLYNLHKSGSSMVSWEQFTDILKNDPRMGNSHMKVPGPDGEFGFGGHCFPKDTEALINYAQSKNIKLSLLEKAVSKNKKMR